VRDKWIFLPALQFKSRTDEMSQNALALPLGQSHLMPRGDKMLRASTLDTGSIIQRETPQVLRKGRKRMVRKRGGQPGNQNAVTHGRFSAPVRAVRVAAAEERAQQHREWLKTMPKTDYGAICDVIRAGSPKRGLNA
jgi:hypothetical protein